MGGQVSIACDGGFSLLLDLSCPSTEDAGEPNLVTDSGDFGEVKRQEIKGCLAIRSHFSSKTESRMDEVPP